MTGPVRKGERILVTGATGQQGGAAARKLLAGGWQVRALVRDGSSAPAQALAAAGAELFVGDLENRTSLDAAAKGVYGVFSVQPADDGELRRGKNVAAAAQVASVRHLVYMSTGGAEGQSRIRTLAKWELEQHVRALGVPWTILRPAGFMEEIAGPRFGLQSGRFATAVKPEATIPLIGVEDIGAFAALSFAHPETYVGRVLELAGDVLTPPQIAAAFSRATGRVIAYVQIPLEVLRQKNAEAAKVFAWVNDGGYAVDPSALRALHPGLMRFDTWLDRVGKAKLEALFGPRPG